MVIGRDINTNIIQPVNTCIFCNKEYSSTTNTEEFIIEYYLSFAPIIACKSCLEVNINMREFKHIVKQYGIN